MKNTRKPAHKLCTNCRKTGKAVIEVVKMVKGKAGIIDLTYHKVLFILEGGIELFCKDEPNYQAAKGKMLFLVAGSQCSYKSLKKSTVVFFRIQAPINLCRDLSLEDLYVKEKRKRKKVYKPEHNNFGELDMNLQVRQLVDNISQSLEHGLTCHYWLEIKVQEFFLLLRIYYSKERIYEFLYPILSNDIAFSEQIRLHWKKFQTAAELAAFLNLTIKKFTMQFTAVFGQTPYQWMLQERARIVLFEVKSTGKLFKEIAVENGFSSESSFTRFCRKEFNKTPTQIRLERLKLKD
ncbi:helix-turn-helix transcriptional regulator [Bacteroides reticulotermitis]|uniref:Transcriptional regulator n=2 Tax=Bacteroides reticulotermitis TaxID=1133319 RepID=W4UNH5_9BACE|nr:helix-turn-helix transcriptional regulator [Bacteroides reticulotermitis]MBB4042491.1 AraC-like DNA-binding protein [Bacteroides reticulotermitis]GAE82069.1 transcriptional regulator [Bacteroides reticulotermitis JCM 10512]